MQEGIAFVVLIAAMITLFPCCWVGLNFVCRHLPTMISARYTRKTRIVARTAVFFFFATIFATAEPFERENPYIVRPMYACLPALFVLTDETRTVSFFVILCQFISLLLALLINIVQLSIGYALKDARALQIIILSCGQSIVSVIYVVSSFYKRRVDPSRVLNAHILQSVMFYDGIFDGGIAGSAYRAYIVPVYSSVSFIFGLFLLLLVSLFVSSFWTCVFCASTDDEADIEAPHDDNSSVSEPDPAPTPLQVATSPPKKSAWRLRPATLPTIGGFEGDPPLDASSSFEEEGNESVAPTPVTFDEVCSRERRTDGTRDTPIPRDPRAPTRRSSSLPTRRGRILQIERAKRPGGRS